MYCWFALEFGLKLAIMMLNGMLQNSVDEELMKVVFDYTSCKRLDIADERKILQTLHVNCVT